MAMSKSDTVNAVADAAGVSKADAEKVLDAFAVVVTDAVKGADKVSWPGFGAFSHSDRAAREGRNPQTGESMQIKASRVMKFSPAKAVKDALNG